MIAYYSLRPDLGQHAWHEEHGFFHGYISGVYYRMVCTSKELEEVREKESQGREPPLDNDEVWWALDVHDYVDPWDEQYDDFESASPFEEDVDFEARRRIIALNMYLDPDTMTWYGLGKQYSLLIRPRRQEERLKAIKQRILALKLDPKMEQHPETRRRRALAFEFGLDPYTATWEEIESTGLELHKVILSQALAWRAREHLLDKAMNFEGLLQRALEYYLDCHKEVGNEVNSETDGEQPVLGESEARSVRKAK